MVEEEVNILSGDESEEEQEGIILGEKREPYNNQEGLVEKLNEIKSSLNWLESLDVTVNLKDVKIPGANEEQEKKGLKLEVQDDFKREMLFYCQAQVSAREALSKLSEMNVPTERPDDYFAEMAKTDVHMSKIRQKLHDRKENMEKSEKAKKQRQLKKIGKKVQQDVLKKRQEDKKKMLQTVDRIKKGKGKLSDLTKQSDDDIFNVSKEDKRKSGMKRKRKDEKFGLGGKKRKVKKNSAESAGEMSSFKSHIHGKAKNVNKQKFGNKNKSKTARPGKSKRMKSRASKK